MSYSFDVKDGKLVNVQYDGGDFDCRERELTSLEGCPEKVSGDFLCSKNQLTSLKGCPEKVSGVFHCYKNQLTSLKGCPERVCAFYCSGNQLTSLEGGPQKVEWEFNCSFNQLKDLKGGPKEVGGCFYCLDNPNLEDISDLSSTCSRIVIQHCPKIKKFPEKIETELRFISPTEEVLKRIKKVPFYEVVKEDKYAITVRQKNIGAQLLDDM